MDLFTEYAFRLSSNTALTATDKLIEKLLALRTLMNYEDQYDEALPAIFSLLVQMGLLGEAYGLGKKLPDQNMQLCKNLFDFIQRPPCKSLAVTFEIITRCNLRCPMCAHGIPERYHKLNQTMSLENFKKAWDNIKNYTGSVVLVGIGETFLHPHIYDIIEYMADTPVIIDTNGNVPLNIDRILGSGVDELVFRVDGIDQDTYSKYRVGGSFDKAVANIKAVPAARQARNLKKPEVVLNTLFSGIMKYIWIRRDSLPRVWVRTGSGRKPVWLRFTTAVNNLTNLWAVALTPPSSSGLAMLTTASNGWCRTIYAIHPIVRMFLIILPYRSTERCSLAASCLTAMTSLAMCLMTIFKIYGIQRHIPVSGNGCLLTTMRSLAVDNASWKNPTLAKFLKTQFWNTPSCRRPPMILCAWLI